MKGAPALVLEFDTAAESFDQFVSVLLTNTGQDDSFAIVTLTPNPDNEGSPQQVGVDLPAGVATRIDLNAITSKFSNICWLSISVGSDQIVPTASFMNFNDVEVAKYLPGDFAVFNLLNGRTRQC